MLLSLFTKTIGSTASRTTIWSILFQFFYFFSNVYFFRLLSTGTSVGIPGPNETNETNETGFWRAEGLLYPLHHLLEQLGETPVMTGG
jgi:hypothetical protein